MLKEISIEIIRKCPNRCVHCSSFSNMQCSEIIPIDKYKEVVNDAMRLGLNTVCFSGGEPFLHPDIIQMVDFANDLGLQTYIYSSGIYVDNFGVPSDIPVELFEQMRNKITKVIFNIEAVNEETYNRIMGTRGYFKYLTSSIRNAVSKNINAEGHFVPMKLNLNQIEMTLQYCQNVGISKVSFLRLVAHGRAAENKEMLSLSDDEFIAVQDKLQQISAEKKYKIRVGVPLLGETGMNHCEAANGKLNIRYDGKVFPCEVFKNNSISILDGETPGNIFESSLHEIYSNSKYLLASRELIRHFSCNKSCENCVGQYYITERAEVIDG